MEPDEHFEDFTTASDWESFTANLELILNEWMSRPIESENADKAWTILSEKITFTDSPFIFTYFKKEGEKKSNDYDSKVNSSSSGLAHPSYLTNWDEIGSICSRQSPQIVADYFAIGEYAVLSPFGIDSVEGESKLKLLLSSACIALNNTNTTYPIFVQYHHRSQNYFYGIAETFGIRTAFQMINLKYFPQQFKYLSGLLDLFKGKLGSSEPITLDIKAHFFYDLKQWPLDAIWSSTPPLLFDLISQLDSGCDNFGKSRSWTKRTERPEVNENDEVTETTDKASTFANLLPIGSDEDPYKSLEYVVGWPSLTDDAVVDSSSYSDLFPEEAPEAYFSLKPDAEAQFLLRNLLEEYWSIRKDSRSVGEVLGKNLEKVDSEFSSALDRLTKPSLPVPVPGLRSMGRAIKVPRRLLFSPTQYTDLAPLSKEQLDVILVFLFPDAHDHPKFSYPNTFEKTFSLEKESSNNLLENIGNVKSCPIGGLVWRLGIVAGNLHAFVGSTPSVAHLWAEFVLELRFRIENSIMIPGLEKGSPNSGTCLLNQKLQMLNCCIERKLAREKEVTPSVEDLTDESEEEFFDCSDNVQTKELIDKPKKPVGRLKKCGKLRLLNSGEPMYIPITQDPAPLTEDVVEEQAKLFTELGTDAEGTEMRAKMLSASLNSDMESFKAANPGAILEDFVRWYSPRDWVEGEEEDEFGNKIGELSSRMRVPGNIWIEVWTNALPIAARRQKRLFDDTKEAERVLHWMSSMSIKNVTEVLFPSLLHASVLKVVEEGESLPIDYSFPVNLSQLSSLSRTLVDYEGDDPLSHPTIQALFTAEREITQIRSYLLKFPPISSLPSNIGSTQLFSQYMKVEENRTSEVGKSIRELFKKEQEINQLVEQESNEEPEFKFGEPERKVFVLTYEPRNDKVEEMIGLPQRMSCLIKNDKILVAGTWSTKTNGLF